MKAAPFEYVAPETIEEAIAHLNDAGGEANVLAGGQTLVPLLGLRMANPTVVVDVNRIQALTGITRTGTGTRIGAITRQNRLLVDPTLKEKAPVIGKAVHFVGHHQTRNRGTLGGSVALGEPAAELPATMLALGAEVEARSVDGVRRIPLADFYLGPYTTALEPHELITALHVPDWPAGTISIVHEVARRPGDFALVGLIALVSVTAGRVTQAAVTWFGMGPQPMRSHSAATEMCGKAVGDLDLAGLADLAVSETDPLDDTQADAAYRRKVGKRIFERRMREALGKGAAA